MNLLNSRSTLSDQSRTFQQIFLMCYTGIHCSQRNDHRMLMFHLFCASSSPGNLREHPQEGKGQEMHGGNEWTVLEPAAGRAPAQRLAQRPAGDHPRQLTSQPHRHAAGLRGGYAYLLRSRPDKAARLPLCLHPGAVSRLLDRRGGQHHPLLFMSGLVEEGNKWNSRNTMTHGHNLTWHKEPPPPRLQTI